MQFALIIVFLLAAFPLRGQATKAELSGLIRDPNGLAISGVTIELTNTGTDTRLSMKSAQDGTYHFFALATGSYRIDAQKEGFTKLRRDGITVRVGDQLSID